MDESRLASRKRVRGRSAAAAAAFAVSALALGACTPSGGSSQSGGNAGQPVKEPSKIAVGEYFTHPVDVEVPGLTGQRVISSTGSQARWSYLPGDQAFNETLAEIVGPHLAQQAASRDMTYTPQVQGTPDPDRLNRGCVQGSTALSAQEILASPELGGPVGGETALAVTCDSVLASGKNYGQKLRFVRGSSEQVVSDYVEILYTNTDSGEVAKGRDLVSDQGLADLYEAIFDLAKLERPMSGDEVIPPTAETLADLQGTLSNVGFDSKGDMTVTVDQDFIAILAAGDPNVEITPMTFTIPADRASINLTELGQEISRSMAAGEAWSGPEAVPSGHEFVDCNLVPCVAVTYDDGPSYMTPQVLDVYAERPYAATTFFILGENIGGQEEIIKRAYDEGHEIANHSWSHPAFTALNDEAIVEQVGNTNAALTAITGEDVVHHRPPYGDLNDRTLAVAGMPAIMWSVDTNDWQQPGYDALINEAVYNAEPDGIVLMHDIHETTVAAAGEIAELLLQRGFTLVTISQLFHGEELPAAPLFTAEDYRS